MISLHKTIVVLCVIFLSVGQILFKLCAKAYRLHGPWNSLTLTFFSFAIILYAITTLAWIWVLSSAELGRVYPLMGLAFVLVPFASYFVFGEQYKTSYFIGVGFIIIGVALTNKR